ncbi:hypothetical protein [Sphingomonas sp.]|uniref:hypothetical protein n=1 Tax=Sphingomonas sp. TaxID=28214 RepID=UPI0025EC446A|nr:hypothetical protein [Sphingomonas sp.]
MWPFTSRRIFGNRWWAIVFVLFVCYQAVDMVDSLPPAQNSANVADNITPAAVPDGTMSEDQMRNTVDSLKSM